MPTPESTERTFGTVRWRSGTGTTSRFSQTRSPKTAFDAQVSKDNGAGKIRVLNQVQSGARASGTNAYPPGLSLLHQARTRSGSTVLRRSTLHGFACRRQV